MNKKILFLKLIFSFLFLQCANVSAQGSETVTILTAYPAPYGRYSQVYISAFEDKDAIVGDDFNMDPNGASNFFSMDIQTSSEITNSLSLNYTNQAGAEDTNIFLRLSSNFRSDTATISSSNCDIVLDPKGISTAGMLYISPIFSFGNRAVEINYNDPDGNAVDPRATITSDNASGILIDTEDRNKVIGGSTVRVPRTGIVEMDGDWLEVEPTGVISSQVKRAQVYAEGDYDTSIYGKATLDKVVREVRNGGNYYGILAGVVGKNISGGLGVYGRGSSGSYGVFGVAKQSVSNVGIRNEAPTRDSWPRLPLFNTLGAGVCGVSYVPKIIPADSSPPPISIQTYGVAGKPMWYMRDDLYSGSESGYDRDAYGVRAVSRNGTGLYAWGNPGALIHGTAYPNADGLYDLGSSSVKWRNLYVRRAELTNIYDPDLAEYYPAGDEVEPGDVVVIDKDSINIKLCERENDTDVIGVVSENPVITIGTGLKNGKPIALLGRVYVKVDATKYPIKEGDLLTTSSSKGYAMKAVDPRPGIVLGKALQSLKKGKQKILVLVHLM